MSRCREAAALNKPLRAVVYIFEWEGTRGGGTWGLVLECGHVVARKRDRVPNSWAVMGHLMFRSIEDKLAPKRSRCHHCGGGRVQVDPANAIRAFGGEVS